MYQCVQSKFWSICLLRMSEANEVPINSDIRGIKSWTNWDIWTYTNHESIRIFNTYISWTNSNFWTHTNHEAIRIQRCCSYLRTENKLLILVKSTEINRKMVGTIWFPVISHESEVDFSVSIRINKIGLTFPRLRDILLSIIVSYSLRLTAKVFRNSGLHQYSAKYI